MAVSAERTTHLCRAAGEVSRIRLERIRLGRRESVAYHNVSGVSPGLHATPSVNRERLRLN